MAHLPPALVGQISPSDWAQTPAPVQRVILRWLTVVAGQAADGLLQGGIEGGTAAGNGAQIPEPTPEPLFSLALLPNILDATPLGIAVHDAQGQLLYINQAGRQLLGLAPEAVPEPQLAEDLPATFQLYREHTNCPYPPEDLPSSRALRGDAAMADDIMIQRDDRHIHLQVTANPVWDDQGQVVYTIATFQDISDLKHQARAYRMLARAYQESEQRYRQMVQSQTDYVLRYRPDSTITFANRAMGKVLGCPAEDLIGQPWHRFIPSPWRDQLIRQLANLTPAAPLVTTLYEDQSPQGDTRWTEWVNLALFDERGTLLEIQSVGRDITPLQRKIRQEQALNQVIQAIRQSLNLEMILQTAVRETVKLFPGFHCYVVQYHPEAEEWRHIAEAHPPGDARKLGNITISDQANPFSERLKAGEMAIISNFAQDETPAHQALRSSLPDQMQGSWCLIPLIIETQVWGSFSINCPQVSCEWLGEDIALLEAIAGQIEIALKQARLYQRVRGELAERQRVEAALRDSESRLSYTAANIPGVVFRYLLQPDGRDRILYMSQGCYNLWEVEAAAVVQDASPLWTMVHPEDLLGMVASVQESARTLNPWHYSWRIVTPSGKVKWLEAAGNPERRANGDVVWDTLILDVTDRKQAELSLRESEERYRLLAQNMTDLVCLHDLEGRYLYVSPSCEALLGYTYGDLLGRSPYEFFHPDDCLQIRQEAHPQALQGEAKATVYRIRHRDGHYCWFETLTRPIYDAQGQVVQLQTTSRDVTQRIAFQEQLRHEARHDGLTGLPNRVALLERLDLALKSSRQGDGFQFVVLFLDLDRFKVVNDSLGHLWGDDLLVTIAQRLQALAGPQDLVARLGGDEFVILLEGVRGVEAAVAMAERIFEALHGPIVLGEQVIFSSVSIGIVLGNPAYGEPAAVLRDADTAMYRAKAGGRSCYEIFDQAMHTQALARLTLENDLRQGIARQEFVLHYQPIICLSTGAWVGCEALIRWRRGGETLVPPGDFIPIAEELGVITQLDHWAIATACQDLAQWRRADLHPSLRVSVNLSVQDLRHPHLLAHLDQVLHTTGLPGSALVLEITESMLIDDIEATVERLSAIQDRGIGISIDDFGTGYSSLSYLHRLPINSLKVDRSFVQQMHSDRRNHQILDTIVALSQHLELVTIAEGVETLEQVESLQSLGYQLAQGYYFQSPLSAAAMADCLRQGSIAALNQNAVG